MALWWETQESERADLLRDTYESAIYGLTKEELAEYGTSERHMRHLFDVGFVREDVSPNRRHKARDEFFEWISELGYDLDDFDWDAWREQYAETA